VQVAVVGKEDGTLTNKPQHLYLRSRDGIYNLVPNNRVVGGFTCFLEVEWARLEAPVMSNTGGSPRFISSPALEVWKAG
jgi:hypothetical protein